MNANDDNTNQTSIGQIQEVQKAQINVPKLTLTKRINKIEITELSPKRPLHEVASVETTNII